MESKISLKTGEEDKDEEWHPLNAMVTENLKNIIIRKIYKDVEKNVVDQKSGKNLSTFRQYLAASGPVTAALSSGMCAGYSAILLPQLMSEDTEIAITKNEATWIASMLALPLIFGCLVSGYLMDFMGRKISQIVFCIPFTIGWIVLACSVNVAGLYSGRLITGLCLGILAPMCQVYIAETCEPRHRGILLSGAPLAVAFGIFFSHVLGTFLTWRITAWICGVPPLICVLILIFVPESPLWLLHHDRNEAAEESYKWFHGNSEESIKDFNALVCKKTEDKVNNVETSKIRLFFNSSFLKPFIVLNVFFFVQQFSGVNAVAFYSVAILKDVMADMNEYLATNIIDVARCIVSVIAVIMLKKFGRKCLSIVSAIGTAVSLFLLATYLACMKYNTVNNSLFTPMNGTNETDISTLEYDRESPLYVITYLPLVFLLLYISFISIGLVPIPWILTGELFSKEMRGIGSGGTASFGFLCYFAVVKLTPTLFETLDNFGTFALFGLVSIIGSLVLGLTLPETKDKTLAEIEAFYTKKKSHCSSSETTQVFSLN